jgi:serine/threonine-protein kinase
VWQAVAIVLAAAVVLLAWRPWEKTDAPASSQVMRFAIHLPITTALIGGAATLAVSPDGKNIVYLALDGPTPVLYLRPMNEFIGHPLQGTENANDPFFSPDGEWIGFFAGSKLKKISIFGGSPQEVCEVGGVLRGGFWADDNTIWYGHINRALYTVPAKGGVPTEVTSLDTSALEISHRFPQVLPGAKGVLFTIKKSNISSFDEAEIAVENLATHQRKTLIHGGSYARYVPTGHILYARGSAIYAVPFDLESMELRGSPIPVIEGGMLSPESGDANYTVSRSGTLVYLPVGSLPTFQVKLVWLDRSGKEKSLLDSLRQYGDGTLSPDGQKLALTIRAANDDVWVYNLKRGTMTRLTFGGGNSDFPIWTPDGNKVMYVSERGRSYKLFWKAWDGSGAEETVGDLNNLDPSSPPAISRDGKYIAYAKGGDIWVMPLDGNGKSQPYIASPAQEYDPAFSPNGKWLSYTSEESGRKEVCVVPFPKQQGKWQISTKGGQFARWLANGKEIVYLEGRTAMKIDVQIQPTFDFGVPQKLFSLPSFTGFFDPYPDGSKFVYGELHGQTSELTNVNVVVGWFDELRQKFSGNAGAR